MPPKGSEQGRRTREDDPGVALVHGFLEVLEPALDIPQRPEDPRALAGRDERGRGHGIEGGELAAGLVRFTRAHERPGEVRAHDQAPFGQLDGAPKRGVLGNVVANQDQPHVPQSALAEQMKRFEQAFEIHHKMGTYLGGVHFELTGENVTECTGGARGMIDADLSRAYKSQVDPRLNYEQSLEMAMLIAKRGG
jgi:hypothetical protein